MNGAYAQMAQSQMYPGMSNPTPRYGGERLMGNAMNTVGAIAGPAGALGAMAMRVDPFTLAMRGYGMGGLVGGAALGLGSMGAGMLVSYAGNQMYTGAQQQQQLNQQMRQSFGFKNQFGGNGFAGSDMSNIGGMMRQMATQQGPAGEMVGFEELGRLASNMGRMGMAQGVRDAKEFSDRFRQMVVTLKDIAKEMGTSLEEAQKMMGGMRSAGVFGNTSASQFAHMIKAGASAGGMATTELTSMMGIGSQMSRMLGGRGSAGARAGIETLTNIGAAVQSGVLTEESIYNATGLTGAEGRQALATQQLQAASSFIRSSKGRWATAAMAGKNGQLDMGDVEAFMFGGQGVEETRKRAYQNLNGVGRANFIRNEGKLRGEVLGQLGGLAPAIMMRGWLQDRGMDLESMGDREMLFFQRQTGMGRDEADNMMQMMRNLPQLMQQRKVSEQDDKFAANMNLRRSHTGIEGIKHKIEAAKASVQNNLRQVGAEFFSEGANLIESFINNLTGTYVQEYNGQVNSAFASSRLGGEQGRNTLRRTFGVGGGATSLIGLGGGGSSLTGAQFSREFGRVDSEAFERSGYGVHSATQKSVQAMMTTASQVSAAMGGPGSDVGVGGDLASALRAGYSKVSGLGLDRLKNVESMIGELGQSNPEAKALSQRLASASPQEKASIIAGINKSIGRADEAKMYATPDMLGVYGAGKYTAVTSERKAIGEALITKAGRNSVDSGLLAGLGGHIVSAFFSGMVRPDPLAEAAGAFLKGKTGTDLTQRLATGDKSAIDDINTQMAGLEQRRDLNGGKFSTNSDAGAYESLRAMRAATELAKLGNASDDKVEALAKFQGYESGAAMRKAAQTIGNQVGEAWSKNVLQFASTHGKEATGRMDAVARAGLVTRGKDGTYTVEGAGADFLGIKGAARSYLTAMVASDSDIANTVGKNAEGVQGLMRSSHTGLEASRDALASMSVAEKRALASSMSGVEGTDGWRQDVLASGDMQNRLQSATKRKGGVGGLGSILGSTIGKSDIQALIKRAASKGTSAEGISAGNDEIARALGISAGIGAKDLESGSAFLKDLSGAVSDVRGGKTGAASEKLRSVMDSDAMKTVRREKAESETPQVQKDMRDALNAIRDLTKSGNAQLTAIATNTTSKDAEDNPAGLRG